MISSGVDGLHRLDCRAARQVSPRHPGAARSRMARAAQVVAAARILAVGTSVPLLMRLPLARLARVLEPGRTVEAADDPAAVIERTIWLVDAALLRGRPVVREGCLTRSITRYWFLRRAGIDVSLAFGTGGVDGRIEAHCWLVYEGRALREPDDGMTFSQLVRIGRPGIVVGVG